MPSTREKPTDYQALHDLIVGKIEEAELTEHQLDRLRRIRAAYAMLLDVQSAFLITGKLMKQFEISQSQAFRDIRLTEMLFGAIRKGNKDFKRIRAEEMALETYRLARVQNNLKGMAAANRNYILATGCNIEDPDLPDFDKLEPSIYPIVLDEEIRKMLMNFIGSSGSLDLTKLIKDAEEAEHEPVEPKGIDQAGDQQDT